MHQVLPDRRNLVFGTKEDMQHHAEGRVKDLQSRGFDQAGLYDPSGVGGTHVMYVLPRADQPHLYSGLPAEPRISAMVGAWKGFTKPMARCRHRAHRVGCTVPLSAGRSQRYDRGRRGGGRARNWRKTMGDAAHRTVIARYSERERINHWIPAIAFVLAALSGLALFHPSMYWMSSLVGGGTWSRILHPFIGLVMTALVRAAGAGRRASTTGWKSATGSGCAKCRRRRRTTTRGCPRSGVTTAARRSCSRCCSPAWPCCCCRAS